MIKYIMVLQDGETFTGLEGCTIVSVPSDLDGEEIEEQLEDLMLGRDSTLSVVATFGGMR